MHIFALISQLIFALRGMKLMKLGFALARKRDKTPKEAAAAKSFLSVFWVTAMLIIIMLVSFPIILTWSLQPSGASAKRYGTVMEDNTVRYVQDTFQYISLEKLGINPAEVSEDDEIIIYFDAHDEILCSVLKREADMKMSVLVGTLFGYIVLFVIATIIMQYSCGRKWREWAASNPEAQALLPERKRQHPQDTVGA